jgi:hypothetical protein
VAPLDPVVAVFVPAPKMPVVPGGPAGPVVFHEIALVPAAHDACTRTLSAPVFVFSQAWIVGDVVAGMTTAALAAPAERSSTAPTISATVRMCGMCGIRSLIAFTPLG